MIEPIVAREEQERELALRLAVQIACAIGSPDPISIAEKNLKFLRGDKR